MSVNGVNGKWQAVVRLRNRKEVQRTFRTKAAAERWERQTRQADDNDDYIDARRGNVLVKDWAWTWLATKGHLAPKSYDRYAGIVNEHILPQWGERRLAALGHAEIQAWISALPVTSSAKAPATVRKVHRVLSMMLGLAVRDNRIKKNNAAGIDLPSVQNWGKHRYLSHAQLADLVDACADERDKLIVLVLAYTGLRWGELAALAVYNFDLLGHRLSIDGSVSEVSGYQLQGLPKDYQRRRVTVPDFIVKPDRSDDDEIGPGEPIAGLAAYCAGRDLSEPLFPSVAGKILRVNNWRRDRFDQAVVRAGLPPGFHPHELRHTAATLAVQAGANIKAIQAMLGHARASMTLDEYADLFPDDLDQVAADMGAARTQSLSARSHAPANVEGGARSR